MLIYFIIAISFAISSLWFIHKRGLAMYNVLKYPIQYDLAYLIICTIIFPIFLLGWLSDSEDLIKAYGENLAKLIKDEK